MAILKATASAKLDEENSTTNNTYKFNYDLKLSGSSEITTLKWHLYELTEQNESTLQEVLGTKFGLGACKLVSDTQTNGETRLYYTKDGTPQGEDCDVTNLGIETQLGSYEIASGTFSASNLSKDESHPEITDLNKISRTIEGVKKDTEVKKYYYLVVEYPNDKQSNQSGDEGKEIDIKLELVSDSVKVELAQ